MHMAPVSVRRFSSSVAEATLSTVFDGGTAGPPQACLCQKRFRQPSLPHEPRSAARSSSRAPRSAVTASPHVPPSQRTVARAPAARALFPRAAPHCAQHNGSLARPRRPSHRTQHAAFAGAARHGARRAARSGGSRRPARSSLCSQRQPRRSHRARAGHADAPAGRGGDQQPRRHHACSPAKRGVATRSRSGEPAAAAGQQRRRGRRRLGRFC
jgi:hypothetical protein